MTAAVYKEFLFSLEDKFYTAGLFHIKENRINLIHQNRSSTQKLKSRPIYSTLFISLPLPNTTQLKTVL